MFIKCLQWATKNISFKEKFLGYDIFFFIRKRKWRENTDFNIYRFVDYALKWL